MEGTIDIAEPERTTGFSSILACFDSALVEKLCNYNGYNFGDRSIYKNINKNKYTEEFGLGFLDSDPHFLMF